MLETALGVTVQEGDAEASRRVLLFRHGHRWCICRKEGGFVVDVNFRVGAERSGAAHTGSAVRGRGDLEGGRGCWCWCLEVDLGLVLAERIHGCGF